MTKELSKNEAGKDTSGSHARKWRLMFSKKWFYLSTSKEKRWRSR